MLKTDLETEIEDLLGFNPSSEESIDSEFEFAEESRIHEYSITSYGADYPVDGLVPRLRRKDIFIPPFQRDYVWSLPKASRFIESILIGLPVPGIFLAKDENNRLLVIDGQQRLKSLDFFYSGVFSTSGKEFRLEKLQSRFNGLTYAQLTPDDRRQIDDYTIHATIVQQDKPNDDVSSVYHIFERLNTGGMQLLPQEIRACVYYGKFNQLLADLNGNSFWREMYGEPSKRMRDREMILRFFAFYEASSQYTRPLKDFLNKYMSSKRNAEDKELERLKFLFESTVTIVSKSIGRKAFRPVRSFNASTFDAVMCGVAHRLTTEPQPKEKNLDAAFNVLIKNQPFLDACESNTTDEATVNVRLSLAALAFKST